MHQVTTAAQAEERAKGQAIDMLTSLMAATQTGDPIAMQTAWQQILVQLPQCMPAPGGGAAQAKSPVGTAPSPPPHPSGMPQPASSARSHRGRSPSPEKPETRRRSRSTLREPVASGRAKSVPPVTPPPKQPRVKSPSQRAKQSSEATPDHEMGSSQRPVASDGYTDVEAELDENVSALATDITQVWQTIAPKRQTRDSVARTAGPYSKGGA